MNLHTFLVVWPTFITINILILSSIIFLALDTAIYAITNYATDISYIESIAIAVTVLAIRGMFNLRLKSFN